MRRAATWVNLIFSSVVVIGVFLQAYFIASFGTGAGETARDMHEFTGFAVVHPAELLVLISGLVAFWRVWRWAGLSVLLFALGTVQIFLAPAADADRMSGWIHGLHGLLAIFVLTLAAIIAHHAMRVLGLRRGAEPSATASSA